MTRVVVTGSTRGLGLGLAEAFCARGCAVMVSGRSEAGVDKALASLRNGGDDRRVAGAPCDVTDPASVQALWDAAVAALGGVDVWINNAGIAHHARPFWTLTADEAAAVVRTNLTGAIHGSSVAYRGMEADGGSIWNMEGFGSDGMMRAGLSVYGASKRALRYFTRTAAKDAAGSRVRIGTLSPGMVVTDLLLDEGPGTTPEERARRTKIFNILADRVETVAPWLADRVLASNGNGAHIAWLTKRKVAVRFATAAVRKRNVLEGVQR